MNRILNARPIVWIGLLSYSLYVWHGGVNFLFGDHLDVLPASLLPIAELLAAVVLAVLSYYLVEKPATHLRSRLREAVAPKTRGVAAGGT